MIGLLEKGTVVLEDATDSGAFLLEVAIARSMNKPILCLHAVSVLAAYCIFGLGCLFASRMTPWISSMLVMRLTSALAAIGTVAGMWFLAVTPGGNKTTVAVAFSTVGAFLLFILSL
jgi:hypothetical protein